MNIGVSIRACDLKSVEINAIDERTVRARWDHGVVKDWLHTQCWIFPGGDAIVVAVGFAIATYYVVLRYGDTVEVVEAGSIRHALTCSGIGVKG